VDAKKLINYTREAFILPANLTYISLVIISILVTFAISFFIPDLLMPIVWKLIMLIGGGLEAIYLGLMPSNAHFIKAVNARYDKATRLLDRKVRALQLLQSLPQAAVQKFDDFSNIRLQIEKNLFSGVNTGTAFSEAYLERLSSLEIYYVELLAEIEKCKKYLENQNSFEIANETQKMKEEIQTTNSERIQEMQRRRLELLEKRKHKIKAVQEAYQLTQIQLSMVEDTLNFLQEQSLSLKSSDELTHAIDNVLIHAEAYEQTNQDLANTNTGYSAFNLPPDLQIRT
jgi:hypothetical protein